MIRGTAKAALKIVDKKLLYVTAIVVAAGSSTRMKGKDKLFAPLGSEPVLASSLRVLQNSKDIHEIILVMSEETAGKGRELCTMHGLDKVSKVVIGGSTRAESTGKGIAAANRKADILLIHDGDRPFLTQDMVFRSVRAAAKHGAATLAVSMTPTVKRGSEGHVVETIPRKDLYEIQTPQAFQCDLLKAARAAMQQTGESITDDCMCVEALGIRPVLVEGDRTNIKITYPEDLAIAEAIRSWKEEQIQ